MYVDENGSVNMWGREEWILIWLSIDDKYEIILQVYEDLWMISYGNNYMY